MNQKAHQTWYKWDLTVSAIYWQGKPLGDKTLGGKIER